MEMYTTLLSLYITLILLYVINVVVWIVFLILPTRPAPVALLSFTDAIYFNNNTEINFPPWIFAFWYVVFLWQLLWITFSFSLAFKYRRLGPPVLLTPTFLGLFVLSLVLQIGVTIAGHFVLELAFVFLLLLAIVLAVCLMLSQRSLYNSRGVLKKQNRRFDDILSRLLVHNGLGLYSVWVTILTFVNLILVIFFNSNIDLQLIITIVLILVGIYVTTVDVLDFVFEKYSRYTITTFIPGIWISIGAVIVNSGRNLIISGGYLGLTTMALITKIVFVVIQSKDRPLYSMKYYPK